MTMHVNLSKEMEAFIKRKVATGFYANATEVIRDAIRRMYADEAQMERFKAAVAEGEADADVGRVLPYTSDLMVSLMEEAAASANNGEPIDPHVAP